MSALLTTGEAMLVLRGSSPGALAVGTHFTASIAGAETTVAIGAARLGHSVSFAGRVGADDGGDLVRHVLAGEGVDVRHLKAEASARTGEMRRYQRVSATSVVTYHRRESAASKATADDVVPAMHDDTRIFHVTGITPALSEQGAATVEALIAMARARQVLVSYDINYRSRLTSVDAAARRLASVLPQVDILFCGEDELHVLQAATGSSRPIHAAMAAGVDEVIIKRGADGATCHIEGDNHHTSAVPIPLVDTVGAGDAFAAGYLSGVLDNLPIGQRLTRAAASAAFCISTVGDWEGQPRRHELDLLTLSQGTAVR
ncbi:sugar kinase [Kribbella sp. NPDC004875]|uniref:sugar kinase n=1 Tax=Kribbella sp. NPDC004875 TaxID=3364107 RepID=UPI0036CC7C0F